jgi:hypothetical protein
MPILSQNSIGYDIHHTNGPDFSSPQGLVIQAVGQKIIAYASTPAPVEHRYALPHSPPSAH